MGSNSRNRSGTPVFSNHSCFFFFVPPAFLYGVHPSTNAGMDPGAFESGQWYYRKNADTSRYFRSFRINGFSVLFQ